MLKTRVITALLLVAGFLAVLFLLPPRAAGIVFALVAALAGWEWAGLMQASAKGRVMLRRAGARALPVCSGPRLTKASRCSGRLAALFWLVVAPLWLNGSWPAGLVRPARARHPVPTWAALVALHGRSPWLLLAVMALVWVADIAAYFAGRAFGKHKLAPTISPGKTWEGVVGAVVGVLLYGMVVAPLLPELRNIDRVVLAACLLLLTALSVIGDLFESWSSARPA